MLLRREGERRRVKVVTAAAVLATTTHGKAHSLMSKPRRLPTSQRFQHRMQAFASGMCIANLATDENAPQEVERKRGRMRVATLRQLGIGEREKRVAVFA